ncbi:MAG: PAS domain S-box protein, partial [candidate division Zixibacteria bacterium]|nr:PAS domain S-box protein [candidate division Zixibacteria bacterium]
RRRPRSLRGEDNLIRKDGDEFVAEIAVYPLFDDSDEMYAMMAVISDITAQNRMHVALKESEQRYRRLFEQASEGILVADVHTGDLLFANPAVCNLLGYSREELERLTIPDIHPEECKTEIGENLKSLLSTQNQFNPNFPCLKKNGEIIYADINVGVAEINSRKCAIGFFKDITDRKKADEQLKFRMEFEELIISLSAKFLEIRTDEIDNQLNSTLKQIGEFVKVDRCFIFQLSEDRKYMIQTHVWCAEGVESQQEKLHSLEVNKFPMWKRKLLKQQHVYIPDVASLPSEATSERVLLEAVGAKAVLIVPLVHTQNVLGGMGFSMLNTSGKVNDDSIKLLRIVADIVANALERISKEKQLKQQISFLRTLINTFPDPVFYKDTEGKYLGCNQSFSDKVIGLDEQSIIGKTLPELKGSDSSQWVNSHQRQDQMLFENPGMQNYDAEVICADGVTREYNIRKAIFYDDDGEVAGLIGAMVDVTELKAVEEALRTSEAKYRVLFEHAAEGILVVDIETKKPIFANPAYCQMYGYAEDELRELTIANLHPKESLQFVNAEFKAQINGEKTLAPEIPCLKKNGEIFYADVNSTLMIINGRKCNVGFFKDITERIAAEKQIVIFKQMVDAAGQGFGIGTLDGKISYINQALIELMEIDDPDALYGSQFLSFYSNETQQFIKNEIIPTVMEKGQWMGELTVYSAKGRQISTIENYFLIRDEHGNPHSIGDIITDNTERKLAEDRIKESEERFRTITDSAHDAIIIMNPQGNISFWNKAAEYIFGHSENEAVGRDLHDLLIPRDLRIQFRQAFPLFQRTGTGNVVGKTKELPAIKKDGSEFPIELSLSAIEHKGKWHAVGIVRDITHRKKSEDELQKAKEDAETANAAKSAFLANISHELRTPLNSIIGFTDLMLKGSAKDNPDKQKEYLTIVSQSGKHLLALINDVLDLAKVEAGRTRLEPSHFNMNDLLNRSLEMVKGVAYKNKIELIKNFDNAGSVVADEQKIRQVVFNLLSNAVKFTPKGGKVGLTTEISEDELIVTVWDTGIGIRQEDQDMVFGEFQQVETSYTRKYKGTGLGLSICKKFVEMHNGRIWVESEPEKGSKFFFAIPLVEYCPIPEADSSEAEEIRQTKADGKTALVVDDVEANLILVSETLKDADFTVYQASNGTDALKLAEDLKPSIILLDIQMPEMDGITVFKKLQENPNTKYIPVVALTSHAMKGDRESFLEMGFTEYISKPIDVNELPGQICGLLDRPRNRVKSKAKA